jgi:nitrite reductase/ring-hydroxylating ferredoxin subunit
MGPRITTAFGRDVGRRLVSSVVGKVDDIAPGKMGVYDVDGRQVAVANVDGTLFAFDDVCTHRGCSLVEGTVSGNVVTCPCHGSQFDVRNGEVVTGPAHTALGTYGVETAGGEFRISGTASTANGTPSQAPVAAATASPDAGTNVEAQRGGASQDSALARVPLFAGLDADTLSGLEAFTFRRTFKPGEVIVEEGRTGNGLYVVLSGEVEVIKGLAAGRPQTAATLGPGEPFGEMALLGDWKRSASVRAVGEVECLGMDRWVFLAHLKREPQIAIMLLHLLAQRLAETNERLLE